MSSTTTDDGTDSSCLRDNNTVPKRKRRKVAIFMAFCGVGYKGMQRNHGAKTIEGDLEEALYQSKAVPESDRCKPKQYDFARSARTDKGVSAIGQVVSGRFYIDPPGFIDRLNANLPDQIRVLGYKRVLKSFSSKKCCDGRRYVYLLPVFALDSMSHRDREAVMASLGSGEEYVKCVECSERGRKVAADVVGSWKGAGFVGKSSTVQSDISSNTLCALALSSVDVDVARELYTKDSGEKINRQGNEMAEVKSKFCSSALSSEDLSVVDAEVARIKESVCELNRNDTVQKINGEVKSKFCSSALSSGDLSSVDVEVARIQEDVCRLNINDSVEKTKFCYGEKEKERFNRILSCYVGSHNFHNFTTRMQADDPAANRHIISFTANTVVSLDGIDFIKCEVVGQSFMLHQIRKMMGLAVAIVRNCAPESLIQTAFSKDVNITVPMAPEHGLYLDECFFTSYNKSVEDSHKEEISMEPYREEAEAFKLKHIYSHIGSVEKKYGNMALWLHSLNYRNYPDLNYTNNGRQHKKVDETQDTTEP